MSDTQRRNESSWDEKYNSLLQTLEDYQEEKENPRKQVVEMDLEELCVHTQTPPPPSPGSLGFFWTDGQQVQNTIQVAY